MAEGLSIRPQTLRLAPQYRRLRDAILRPHLRLTESRYFWEQWKPRLGPDAAVLIMEVRDRCNRALATTLQPGVSGVSALANDRGWPWALVDQTPHDAGSVVEGVDGCAVSANELAAACGFSRVTLWRLLQREDVRRFIRVEHNYVYDRRLGKKRRTVSTYHVLMEDPLVEEDEARLEALAAATPTVSAEAPTAPTMADQPPTVQSEMMVVDNSPPRFQPATNRGGSKSKPQNVPETIFKERLGPNATTPSAATRTAGTTPLPLSVLTAGLLTAGAGLNRVALAGAPVSAGAAAGAAAPSQVTAALGAPRAPATQRAVPEVDIWRKYPDLAHYVEEAEQLLGDTHSRGFYLKALKRLHPGHMGVWQRALGVAREQTNIRRSRGALFTRLLRTFAAEAGVTL